MNLRASIRDAFGLEARAADGGTYTERVQAQIMADAAGSTDARALAVVEAVAGTFERALSLAEPRGRFADALRPHLGQIGRHLAARGEWVALIDVPDDGAGVRLMPAGSWDVRGGFDEGGWTYRLDLFGPSGNVTRLVPGGAVVHVRVNALAETPWHGRSALAAFPTTAKLAGRIEGAMSTEFNIPPGRTLALPGRWTPEQLDAVGGNLAARRLATLGTGGHSEGGGSRLHEYGPAPDDGAVGVRRDVRTEILAAYGLSAVLFEASGDGTAQREAWRRAGVAFQSYAAAIVREGRAKLADDLSLDLSAVATADVQGRSRAFKALTDAGMDAATAAHNAGIQSREG